MNHKIVKGIRQGDIISPKSFTSLVYDPACNGENDINIRHKGNEESDEQYSPPRGLIERLPSDQSTQRPEDTRNSIVPVKDSQENEKTTVTEDLAFAEEHRVYSRNEAENPEYA
ncbi:Hypothetical predicted protein [Octopus vulgaris]|uniref:Uncharacterized protein n=1 Tax=Octopus vulgaris TaxID=6645 RepID=A0AA36FHK5_OCTVU|nr:Hypothetical predicted protein [Octopus vulgaris]